VSSRARFALVLIVAVPVTVYATAWTLYGAASLISMIVY
jgi:hypothetical protein